MGNAFKEIESYIKNNYGAPKTYYLDLYAKKVRLLVFSLCFEEYITTQIPYIISSKEGYFDATIYLWKEQDLNAPQIISEYNPETNTYYYGVVNTDYEEFIKQGHFLVQIFYKILKSSTTSLVHGAVVGLNNEGILVCAKGQRGKSTLTVLSMFKGMEYVSDDYLYLESDGGNNLSASPIYSIITLSPFMSEQLKDGLKDCIKLGWNARKDKYVFNIASKHDRFRKNYPIKLLMFPEIVDDEDPFIREATPVEKGRAITQLIYSTTFQMSDTLDKSVTLKIIKMLSNFPCYYFGLSKDVNKNSDYLIKFMKTKTQKEKI